MLLIRCQTTGMSLKLHCEQLSQEMALTVDLARSDQERPASTSRGSGRGRAAIEAAVVAEVSDLVSKKLENMS